MAIEGINIFARELAQALEEHNIRIGQLNDNPRINLHPAVVSRLQRSLVHPKPLVTLNPEDLDRVIQEYDMSDNQQARLKAAVLATAVERTLMDRIDEDTALVAANEVFHILRDALVKNPELGRKLRGGTWTIPAAPVAAGTLEAALEAYDAAMLDLHLATRTPIEQQGFQAAQAQQGFMYARTLLLACSEIEKQHTDWQYWFDEVERGQHQAQALM